MTSTAKPRWFLLVVVIVVLSASFAWVLWRSQRGWTASELETLIQAEIRPNCDRAMTESWLARHGIPFNWFDDVTGDRRGHSTMPELAGLKQSELSGMLRGEIAPPHANVDLISPGRISVYFFFDRQGRLAGHLVFPCVYSL